MKRYVDYIRDIIICMNDEDCKEFRVFIQRQRSKKSRVDLQLFEILREDKNLKASEICSLLYEGRKGMNAYHSVRKRLLKQLTEFLVIKRMERDTTAASSIMGLLSVASFLFDNGSYATAWHYLNKCEELALDNEQYDLLDNVYNLQISNAHHDCAPPLDLILDNWKQNKVLADEDERVNVANTIIKINLEKYRIQGGEINISELISSVLEEYELNDVVFKRPKVLYNFLSIVRSEVLATKDYFTAQQLMTELYEEMNRKELFKKKDQFYKLSILYMICHVTYRSRKFKTSLEYLEEFKKEMEAFGGLYKQKFINKYRLLSAAVRSYIGDNKISIDLLHESLDQKGLSVSEELDMKLNLTVYYFQQEDFGQSLRILATLGHTDAFCAKKMGGEWLMRKSLIELLTHYEKGNTEISMNKIRSFKQNYKALLQNPLYNRIVTFLKFIELCIEKPYWIATKEFNEFVDSQLERWPLEREDLQAMAFYCWLKSKMMKKSYYHVLVETVNGRM